MIAASTCESDLLARLRAGDDDAFELLVRQHTPRMLSIARRFVASEDDAADAVQDAFLSAFKALPTFEGGSTLATWLHRIVVNSCLMKIRSQNRRRTRSIEELLPKFDDTGHHSHPVSAWSESAFGSLLRDETRAQIRANIAQLPDDYRTVIVLRDIEEMDTDQTAAILGIRPGAVKTRLHRARQALRSLIASSMQMDIMTCQ
jgi:RNA polymerase sigma-70 factor (ECF subfamily)